ncbi:hypothetical protein K8R30_03410 [archaeon]|nr:hypothetical protein [archaeon]
MDRMVATAIVGERGLRRHLDEKVILRKRGVEYSGPLGVHGDRKFFVGVESIWEGPGEEDRKCGNDNARVYINEPGKDIIHLLGKNYRVGSGKRVDQFRDFMFVSENPTEYKANRRRLSNWAPVITERGLEKNLFNFCAVRKPSKCGGYSEVQSGLIVGDKERGFGIIWMGNGKSVGIEEWDRIILTQKARGGGRYYKNYTYRERLNPGEEKKKSAFVY